MPQLTPLNLVSATSRHLFECSLAWGTFGLWSGGLLRPFDRVPRHHQGEAGGWEGSLLRGKLKEVVGRIFELAWATIVSIGSQ